MRWSLDVFVQVPKVVISLDILQRQTLFKSRSNSFCMAALAEPFIPVPGIGLKEIADFSLITSVYAHEMAGNSMLPERPESLDEVCENLCRDLVPLFVYEEESWDENLDRLKERLPQSRNPTSIKVESLEQLEACTLAAFEVAYAHYLLGKEYGVKGHFPFRCCGISARNVFLSMLFHGFHSAAYAAVKGVDHAYVILPFVWRNVQATIRIEPTAEQMYNDHAPKVAVAVLLGSRWQYVTDWKSGVDLFPNI